MNGMDSLPISFPGSSVGKESITGKQPQILNLFSWCPFVTGLKAWVSDENTSLSLGLLQSYIFKKFPKAYGFGFFILYFLSLLFASVFFVLSPSFSLDHQSPGPAQLGTGFGMNPVLGGSREGGLFCLLPAQITFLPLQYGG